MASGLRFRNPYEIFAMLGISDWRVKLEGNPYS